jgi:CRP-like cAMP-binding protein
MKYNLFDKVYSHPLLTSQDIEKIKNAHTEIDFSKGKLFLESGKTANEYYLIEKGICRSYTYDYNNKEITTDFFISGEILIEVMSLFQRTDSNENLIALTNGAAWKIEFEDFQELFHKIEGFREWGRAWMSKQLFDSKQRSIEMHTKNATDRYLTLLNDKPQIIKQATLKQIASYLGITDTSLSRIRKEIFSN